MTIDILKKRLINFFLESIVYYRPYNSRSRYEIDERKLIYRYVI